MVSTNKTFGCFSEIGQVKSAWNVEFLSVTSLENTGLFVTGLLCLLVICVNTLYLLKVAIPTGLKFIVYLVRVRVRFYGIK